MNTEGHDENTKKIIATIVILLAVVLATVGINALSAKKSKSSESATAPSTTTNSATNSSASSTPSGTYTDGTYKASGSYDSPGGAESITVTVTLKDNTITNTSAQASGNDRDSQFYQGAFIDGYKGLVVGKKIDAIHLSQVSGSSLTSQGFNSALDEIKNEAKAS